MLEKLQNLLNLKKSKSYYAERLSKQEGREVTVEEVEELMKELKSQETVEEGEIKGKYSEDINYEKGSKTIQYSSDKPLSPRELEELAKVDNINTYIARTWLKSSDKGTWNYSIDVRYRVNNFYTGEELKEKIRALFPKNISPFPVPNIKNPSDKVLMVYIGDDHCGLILKDSQYGNEQSEEVYRGRLNEVYNQIVNLNTTFSKIYIISLGDELDGYNGFTTRGGHQLGSASNKEQFDIYVNSRVEFYNKLFTSSLAEKFVIVNQNNSNHTGKGLSYMANRAIEMYLEQAFSNVYVINTDKLIQVIEVGNHVFGLVHGKDDTHQKNPMPLNLDAKTDAYMFEFYDKQGYSPSKDWIHTIKADIHKYNVNMGKHGRYVNIPSISSGSNWIEANFGNSKPGVLMEIVNPNSENIISIPIWF